MFRVAINECKDFFRSLKFKSNAELDLNQVAGESNSIIVDLSTLSIKYFMPLYLYYYEGYQINEISDILKISESATKLRLKRGKAKLKKEMEI